MTDAKISKSPTVEVRPQILPENQEVEASAELTRDLSLNHPPLITTTLKNISNISISLDLGFTPPFSTYTSTRKEGDASLILIPSSYPGRRGENIIPSQPKDGCWTANRGPETLDSGKLATVPPNGKITEKYTLLNHPDNLECFPPGEYVFSESFKSDGSRFKYHLEITVLAE